MFSPTLPLQRGGNHHEKLIHSNRSAFRSDSECVGAVQHVVHEKSTGATLAPDRLAIR
jgi:hypothetical protein